MKFIKAIYIAQDETRRFVASHLARPLLCAYHYENTPMQYTAIFHGCKNDNYRMKKINIFLIFPQNIDCGYTEAVLTSTHNICFRAKIRK